MYGERGPAPRIACVGCAAPTASFPAHSTTSACCAGASTTTGDPITFRARACRDPIDSFQYVVEYVVDVAVEPPAEHWGLIAGDVLTNARAALDHGVFARITSIHDLTEAQQRKLQFLVFWWVSVRVLHGAAG